MANLIHALVFIINTVMGLYTAAVMLRFLMQQVRADFHNPMAQAVMSVTNPLLFPLRRLFPPLVGIDTAALVLMLLLQFLNVLLVTFIANLPGQYIAYTPGYLLGWTLIKLIYILVNLYFFTILMEVVLSWVHQGHYHPLGRLFRPLNAPLLRPFRIILPPMGGFDFSPLLVILLLQVLDYFLLPHIWPLMGI